MEVHRSIAAGERLCISSDGLNCVRLRTYSAVFKLNPPNIGGVCDLLHSLAEFAEIRVPMFVTVRTAISDFDSVKRRITDAALLFSQAGID